MQVNLRRIAVAAVAAVVSVAWSVVPAAAATTFDGGYRGTYTGTLEGFKVSGEVVLTVVNGVVTVTAPVSGKGGVGAGGDADFGGILAGEGYDCIFTGKFVAQANGTTASGPWSCGKDGGGTWTANRTTAPATTLKPVTPTTPTTAVRSNGTATATKGTITVRRANGRTEQGKGVAIQPGDRITTGSGAVRVDLPGRGRVDAGPNSTIVLAPDGSLTGLQGSVTITLAGGGGAGLRIATGAGPSGAATVAFSDGSKVVLGASSSFAVGQHTPDAMVLDNMLGTLKGAIKKLTARRFQVRTPTACACVRGTAFTLTATPTSATLTTTEGIVAFTSLATGASVDVPAGHRSTITSGPPSPPTRV